MGSVASNPMWGGDGRLRAEGVRTPVAGPIDLTVEPAELVFLSGPSGAGKSLFLRALADLDPHAGHVWFDGREAAEVPPQQWRRAVAYLPAESHWWSERVGDHFWGSVQGLKELGFGPEVMGWEVRRTSTGERQRLALLRLLATGPRALLLDEPTASLDPEGVRRAEALIQDYAREHRAPVLWVSHDPTQIARLAHRHFRFEGGQLKRVKP